MQQHHGQLHLLLQHWIHRKWTHLLRYISITMDVIQKSAFSQPLPPKHILSLLYIVIPYLTVFISYGNYRVLNLMPITMSSMCVYNRKPVRKACYFYIDCVFFIDINECEMGSHRCNVNAKCQNTVGGYNCSCNVGYTGNGFHCNGI